MKPVRFAIWSYEISLLNAALSRQNDGCGEKGGS
jgi:hypothetical protein